MKKIRNVILIIVSCLFLGMIVLGQLIKYGVTNAASAVSTWTYNMIPNEILNNPWFKFTLDGMDTRKAFTDSVYKRSKELWVDDKLVMACVMAEQVRITTKGVRGNLKNLILNTTPKLLRSYNVSLGIGGIKVTTAQKIKRDANVYWYWHRLWAISASWLADNDALNAQYATFLVNNIATRRRLSGYDISKNPGVLCTLYNLGNPTKKQPHENPQVGWAVIPIGKWKYTYGEIAVWIYQILQIKDTF